MKILICFVLIYILELTKMLSYISDNRFFILLFHIQVSQSSDSRTRWCVCILFMTMSLISSAFFISSAWMGKNSLTVRAINYIS